MQQFKISYVKQFNKQHGKWLIFKHIEGEQSYNFTCVYEGTKQGCKEKYEELCKRKN